MASQLQIAAAVAFASLVDLDDRKETRKITTDRTMKMVSVIRVDDIMARSFAVRQSKTISGAP
jgi:hypothetical protein